MRPHDFVECSLPADQCAWQDECHYAEGEHADCLVSRSAHAAVNSARAFNLTHWPNRHGSCVVCSESFPPGTVVVYADSSRQNTYHLKCYLAIADINDAQNDALRAYVHSVLESALESYIGL